LPFPEPSYSREFRLCEALAGLGITDTIGVPRVLLRCKHRPVVFDHRSAALQPSNQLRIRFFEVRIARIIDN
jgi:hypothetical protein